MCYSCLKQSCVVIQNGKIPLSSESCRSEVVDDTSDFALVGKNN